MFHGKKLKKKSDLNITIKIFGYMFFSIDFDRICPLM